MLDMCAEHVVCLPSSPSLHAQREQAGATGLQSAYVPIPKSRWVAKAREPTSGAGKVCPTQGASPGSPGGTERGVALRRVPVSWPVYTKVPVNVVTGTCAGVRWAVEVGSGGGREL